VNLTGMSETHPSDDDFSNDKIHGSDSLPQTASRQSRVGGGMVSHILTSDKIIAVRLGIHYDFELPNWFLIF